jgi:hypothetical protein
MLLYVESWLPLLIIALTAGIVFGVASFVMGRASTPS